MVYFKKKKKGPAGPKGGVKTISKPPAHKKTSPSSKSKSSQPSQHSAPPSSSTSSKHSKPPTPQNDDWLTSLITTASSLDTSTSSHKFSTKTKAERIASRNTKLIKKGKPIKLNRKKPKNNEPQHSGVLVKNENSRKKFIPVEDGVEFVEKLNSQVSGICDEAEGEDYEKGEFEGVPRKKKKQVRRNVNFSRANVSPC